MNSVVRDPLLPSSAALAEAAVQAGRCRILAPLDRTSSTLLFVGEAGRLVLERPEAPISAEATIAAVTAGRTAGVPAPPVFLLADGWLARPWVEGGAPTTEPEDLDSIHTATLDALRRMRRAPLPLVPPGVDVVEVWLGRIAEDDPGVADRLRDMLNLLDVPSCLVHGDVAPQNFLLRGDGPVLVDWKGAGIGRPGFDSGWVLALNAIGRGLRRDQDHLFASLVSRGVTPEILRWGEALGLARLRWRSRRLSGARGWTTLVTELLSQRLRGGHP